jgi:hypothetical protein
MLAFYLFSAASGTPTASFFQSPDLHHKTRIISSLFLFSLPCFDRFFLLFLSLSMKRQNKPKQYKIAKLM